MDPSIHLSWKVVSIMERIAGLWPYQHMWINILLSIQHAVILVSCYVAELLVVIKGTDPNIMIENSVSMACVNMIIAKLLLAIYFNKQRKILFEKIGNEWKHINAEDEAQVLRDYAQRGLMKDVTINLGLLIAVIIYFGSPVAEMYIKYILYDESGLQKQIPMMVDYYFFDPMDHFYFTVIHTSLAGMSSVIVNSAFDLSFIVQIQYARALFRIVIMRLEKSVEVANKNLSSTSADAISQRNIADVVRMHISAIELVSMLEESYRFVWLILFLEMTVAFGAGIVILQMNLQSPLNLLRYTAMFIMCTGYTQMMFNLGDKIKESSSDVSNACFDCHWYKASKEYNKMLMILMLRCTKDCKLTGGGIMDLSMENFGKMMKTGFSYYTMVKAMY